MACVRRLEVPPPETRNKCDAIFKSRVVARRHSPHILGSAGRRCREVGSRRTGLLESL